MGEHTGDPQLSEVDPLVDGVQSARPNTIQVTDLVGRKLDVHGGEAMRELLADVHSVVDDLRSAGGAFAEGGRLRSVLAGGQYFTAGSMAVLAEG